MEELTWLNSKSFSTKNSLHLSNNNLDGNDLSDLMNTYQQKISSLNDEISNFKDDIDTRDKEISQLRIQIKVLKQRSQSLERDLNSSDENGNNNNRFKRGVSVDAGGNLREQLEASADEIRLLKNKLLRLEDELNSSVIEKESLLSKIDDQSKQVINDTINKDIQLLTSKIGKTKKENFF